MNLRLFLLIKNSKSEPTASLLHTNCIPTRLIDLPIQWFSRKCPKFGQPSATFGWHPLFSIPDVGLLNETEIFCVLPVKLDVDSCNRCISFWSNMKPFYSILEKFGSALYALCEQASYIVYYLTLYMSYHVSYDWKPTFLRFRSIIMILAMECYSVAGRKPTIHFSGIKIKMLF